MRSCFVSIPFGTRPHADGRRLDFDFLYTVVIQPAVESVGLECRRLDEYLPGAIWHKTLLSAIISSDLVIADITTDNANVFYELGIRHALRRGRTILISGGGRIPGNISYAQALWYTPDVSGRLTGEPAAEFRDALRATIRRSQHSPVSDSPIYEFFPDLEVILPSELETSPRRRRSGPTKAQRGFAQSVVESPAQAKGDLETSEAAVRGAPEADPAEYLTLLRRYRDISEWDRVIALADDAPQPVAQSSEVRQMLALALNRRGHSGDQDRAIALMEQQIAETGGDSETFGILGRIYKDRYEEATARGDAAEAAANLERALQHYRSGFEKNPRDYYPGINVVNLLLLRGDDAARAELEQIVPRVRAAVQEKIEIDRPDFWNLATDLQLAAVARDWTRAGQAAQLAMAQVPADWMLETTLRDIRAVGKTFGDPDDRRRLEGILVLLQPSAARGGTADD